MEGRLERGEAFCLPAGDGFASIAFLSLQQQLIYDTFFSICLRFVWIEDVMDGLIDSFNLLEILYVLLLNCKQATGQ